MGRGEREAGNDGGSRRRRALRVVATALALALAAPAWASALLLDGPANAGASAEIGVTAEATDPSGTVALTMDGSLVGTAALSPGDHRHFAITGIAPGTRTFAATLGDGSTTATAVPWVVRSWATPGAPAWVSPAGGYAGRTAPVRLIAGSSTTTLTVTFNGAILGRVAVTDPAAVLDFGTVAMPAGVSTFVVTEENPLGLSAAYPMQVRRLDYPYATCIIIDKSDRRLYWIRNGVLVKAYPIAIGKRRTPTPVAVWKVGRKEKTPPRGVYGPRKLRLFRRVRTHHGYRYKYTNYAIHGTNQPWVIGTMASHGCIRLTNDQILDLWPQVPTGTMVITRN